jgi:hypothetical protein
MTDSTKALAYYEEKSFSFFATDATARKARVFFPDKFISGCSNVCE